MILCEPHLSPFYLERELWRETEGSREVVVE